MAAGKRPQVVIVGAGFGGLWAARTLANTAVDVLMLDHNNYHTFLPLLYQVAAAELEPEQIAYPVRSILRKMPNVNFAMAEVRRIDFSKRVVETDELAFPYDYLVLATGSTSHFFGVPGAAEHAFSLKTLEQGVALRNHILYLFERAANEPDAERRQKLLTIIIVGGGPTGVEYAGALAELINSFLVSDYPALDFREVRVVLLEAAGGLLSGLPESMGEYAALRLSDMGVEVRFQAAVSRITGEAVYLKDGGVIPTETVVWTAGVRGDPLAEAWGMPTARDGRVKVLPSLQVPDQTNIYVVGDLAFVEEDGRPLPMVAPVAVQEGVAAARNIIHQVSGEETVPFRYKDRGTMATIGRNAAVARLGERAFTGFLAWILWLGVHLFNLIGFRNRILVMINWAWDYFLFERAVRFIFPSSTVLQIEASRFDSRNKDNQGDKD